VKTTSSSQSLAFAVLAAGRGRRLSSHGHEEPKWLLPVADRRIAEYQIEGIAAAAQTDDLLVLVSGFGEEKLMDWLAERELPAPLQVVNNHDWSARNNWFSLLLAVELLDEADWQGGLVVINSDLCAWPELFTAFINDVRTMPPRRPVLAVDFDRPLTDEAMKVAGVNEAGGDFSCSRIGKANVDNAAGEYIGLAAFAAPDWPLLISALKSMMDPVHHDAWYEAVFQRLMDRNGPFAAWSTAGFDWTEIDDAQDWKRACEVMASR